MRIRTPFTGSNFKTGIVGSSLPASSSVLRRVSERDHSVRGERMGVVRKTGGKEGGESDRQHLPKPNVCRYYSGEIIKKEMEGKAERIDCDLNGDNKQIGG